MDGFLYINVKYIGRVEIKKEEEGGIEIKGRVEERREKYIGKRKLKNRRWSIWVVIYVFELLIKFFFSCSFLKW